MLIDEKEIEKFSGEWVLIFGDKVVNHSSDLEDILKTAETYPMDEVTIAKLSPLPYNPKLMED